MNKLIDIIKLLLEKLELVLEKLKLVLVNNVVFQKLKQNIVVNNVINNAFNFVMQHKLISIAIVTAGVIAMPELGSKSYYPEECYGVEVRTMPGRTNVRYGNALAALVASEDPQGALGSSFKMGEAYHKEYSDDVISKIFNAKYVRLLKSSGKEDAELLKQQITNACIAYNEGKIYD